MKLKLLAARLILLFAIFSLPQFLLAQQKTITGKVTNDSSGAPLAGVTISAKGAKAGTQTGADGSFTLSVPSSVTTLAVSSVGYNSKDVSLNGNSSVNITLTETAATGLNEVVVIGYGTARKKDLTGAVASVGAKDFNKGTYTSADQLIQGKVSGVQMINNTGTPGGASTVKIRGNSTVTGSGQPLYIVDGVPLDGRSPRPGLGDVGLGGSNPGNNPLNFINPADIASIDILKDASATAIYGSRAAYGVVLITTKRGASGQPKIDFNASTGFSKIAKKLEVLDADQFRKALTYYGLSNANDKGANVDALDEILHTGVIQNYNMALSGGNDNSRFRVAFGVLDQTGIVKRTGIKKYSANISANFKFLNSKKLGLDITMLPSQYIEDIAPISNNAGSRGSLIGNALQWNPTERLVLRNSTNTRDSLNVVRGGDLINPVALQQAIQDQSKVTTVLASISPYFKFTNFLEYRFLYSVNYGTGVRRTSIQPFINFNDVIDKGRALIANNELMTMQATNTLNFNKALSKDLNLNALVGYEYIKYSNKGSYMGGFGAAGGGFGNYGLDFTNYLQFTNPTNRTVGAFADPTYEIQSYFTRAVINYKDRYLVTGTFRADGSTKFGANNKYGYFPSFSAAWVVTNEDFFKVDAISSLKIRGGWGKTGNQEFPSGSAQRRYNFGGDGTSINISNNANEDLKWQSDRQYNIGLDATLFKNRINVTMDYFNKNTSDLLFPTEPIQPAAPGGAITWKNLDGNIVNKGFEAAVNATIVNGKAFSWNFGGNVTFIKNNVTGLISPINTGALDGQGISGTTVEVLTNNYPINAFFTRQFAGFDKDGIAIYPNGDVVSYQGSPNPSTLLGISTTLQYKKLSLIVNMNGAFGQKIYNNTLNNVINVGSINNGKNIALSVYESPIKESFANAVTASSRFLEKGDYVKLTNATLSYGIGNIGKSFKGANIYVTGQNLFAITKYTGFDPEVNVDKNVNGVPSVGIEYIPYPSARTVTIGVNFSL